MSRLKNMSRGGYIVVGIVAALILIPTGIAEATIAYTGIEGTNGATATVNPADVTAAGQQLTTEANPSTFYQTSDTFLDFGTLSPIATPITNHALIVTAINVDVSGDSSPGGGSDVLMEVRASTCAGAIVKYTHAIHPGGIGVIEIDLAPGLVVPKGDVLCAEENGTVIAGAQISGYTVTPTDAPS